MSSSSPPPGEEGETDAEQVQREWYLWVVAALLVGGAALALLPLGPIPGELAFLGAIVVVFVALGWLFKRFTAGA